MHAPTSLPDWFTPLQAWQDRSETASDNLSLQTLRALAVTLDHDAAALQAGSQAMPLAHWLAFQPLYQTSAAGVDGHARRGGLLPPVPLPRRMWASSALQWQPGNPLRAGDAIERHSRIASVQHKQGGSGELVFVTVQHDIHNAQGLALTDKQHIVYRAAATPGAAAPAPVAAEQDADWQREIDPSPLLLFRYSALTFNGHRIHYDRSYAQQEEGYPGLVVHGPLIATLLMDLLLRQLPDAEVRSFSFRAVRPTFDGQPFRVCGRLQPDGKTVQLWAQDHEGWLTMQAQAELA
ncbi:MaoC family dehydratase N-terminal domain-containing protein [Brachymonas sp. G13]|uniref:FAS1-like dehydratase domain-containing protein n=1 Tax=Brachymonas wangyanguii TaxID=3130163 RepID=UPI0016906FAC|nr:acyl-CoA dehydrogenase [Ramlibacter sp.]